MRFVFVLVAEDLVVVPLPTLHLIDSSWSDGRRLREPCENTPTEQDLKDSILVFLFFF